MIAEIKLICLTLLINILGSCVSKIPQPQFFTCLDITIESDVFDDSSPAGKSYATFYNFTFYRLAILLNYNL